MGYQLIRFLKLANTKIQNAVHWVMEFSVYGQLGAMLPLWVMRESYFEYIEGAITHDLELINECCDYIIHIDSGKISGSYALDNDGQQKLCEFFTSV